MRRRLGAGFAVLVVLSVTAGYLFVGDDTATTALDAATAECEPGTETSDASGGYESEPDPDKRLSLSNDWYLPVTVEVAVVRNATCEPVHTGTYRLWPTESREVYNTAAADPDGVERFTFVVTARNTTQRVTIRTSRLITGPHFRVWSDGSMSLSYGVV